MEFADSEESSEEDQQPLKQEKEHVQLSEIQQGVEKHSAEEGPVDLLDSDIQEINTNPICQNNTAVREKTAIDEYCEIEIGNESTAGSLANKIVWRVQTNSLRLISESKKSEGNGKVFSNLFLIDSFLNSKNQVHNYLVIRSKVGEPDSIYHCTTFDSSSNFSFLCTNKGKIIDLRCLPFVPDDKGISPNLLVLVSQKTNDPSQKTGSEPEELVLYNIDTHRKKIKSLLKLKIKLQEICSPLAVKHCSKKNGEFEFAVLILPDNIFFSQNVMSSDRWFADLSNTMTTFKIPDLQFEQKSTNAFAINFDSSEQSDRETILIIAARQDSNNCCLLMAIDKKDRKVDASKTKCYHLDAKYFKDQTYTNVVLNSKLGFFALLGIKKKPASSNKVQILLLADYRAAVKQIESSEKSPSEKLLHETIRSSSCYKIPSELQLNTEDKRRITFAEGVFKSKNRDLYLIIYAVSNTSTILYCIVHRSDNRLEFKYKNCDISKIEGLTSVYDKKISSISKSIIFKPTINNEFNPSISVTLQDGYTFHLNLFLVDSVNQEKI